MQILLNGAPVETAARTLADLVEERALDATSVATALDAEFVPRALRPATSLTEGARVEIVAPMQGG
ncbi:sulfur carrier protein ThiS [Acidimangrovimonas sediminis]|uniref:sulfur carrier protein ThiS n=1 Tax=Acidimangrovimonas sediminis TaxID=2056283 RepID=UPI000C7F9724|nr:sulfur carrier protein ThiS [Acidimangrovimonas sediminis]